MDQTSHYTPNQFFLKREEGVQHGGVKITAMTHIPRILTETSALSLAAELVKLAGGLVAFQPVIEAAYGGPEKLHAAIEAELAAKNAAAAPKPAAPVAPAPPPADPVPPSADPKPAAPVAATTPAAAPAAPAPAAPATPPAK